MFLLAGGTFLLKQKQRSEKGVRLFEGKGVPRNVREAVKCFCEAANDGNVRAIIKVIDLDETGDPEIREAIVQFADDTLKRRLEFFRTQDDASKGKPY
jgi:TPR repeat protein